MEQAPTAKLIPIYPVYRSHKTVEAFKIHAVKFDHTNNMNLLEPENIALPSATVSDDYIRKHDPVAGGYWVRYADGYESFSPAEAFDGGYTAISSDVVEVASNEQIPFVGLPLEQEPKYTTDREGRIINRATGIPIPPDEPIFILRAKDALATNALACYKAAKVDDGWKERIFEVMKRFWKWQQGNAGKVKQPD